MSEQAKWGQVLRAMAADAQIRGMLPLLFPGLRRFGNKCLTAVNLNPFSALSVTHGLCSVTGLLETLPAPAVLSAGIVGQGE